MLFPKKAKEAIASVFYTTEVKVFEVSIVTDDEGGVTIGERTFSHSFKGNAQYPHIGTTLEQIGLTFDADIVVTCDSETIVRVNNYIQVDEMLYQVTEVIPTDSHLKVVGKHYEA